MSYIDIVSGHTSSDDSLISIHALADYGYDIRIEQDMFALENTAFANAIEGRESLVVISPTIHELYGEKIIRYLNHHLGEKAFHTFVCPSGEANKTMDSVVKICAQAKDAHLDRDGLFIGIGGGIILDMVGFAASIYRRGTKFIKVPTTLVGQVDVAVGLKTGVNSFLSKNMLGNYYPAYKTFNDPTFLRTLPVRELRCGMAEVIKMALVCDEELFQKIVSTYENLDVVALNNVDYAIYHQAMVRMAEELQPNLLESDLERLVDFGHTFSMRFEVDSDHSIFHGEAVAIDMALSCCIAKVMGLMSSEDCDRAIWVLKRSGLAIYDESVCTLESFKKSIYEVTLHRKAVNLVVPIALGKGVFIKRADQLGDEILQRSLESLIAYSI